MAKFADQISIACLDGAFLTDLITVQIGLERLFDRVYELDGDTPQQILLGSIRRLWFQRPVFETWRTRGSDQRTHPHPERIGIDREHPRQGRLTWIDLYAELTVDALLDRGAGEIESAASSDLFTELGEPDSLAALRAALVARFGESVAAAALEKLRIESIDQFRDKAGLFLDIASASAPAFDPADPANAAELSLGVCFRFESTLDLTASLRSTQLCRSVLENERQHAENVAGAAVKRPFAFAVLFPETSAVDDAIPGLTADQVRDRTQALFAREEIDSVFVTGF